MTELKRELKRTTRTRLPNGRSMVIELEPPNIITLRESGRRKRVSITTETLYIYLIEREIDRARAEKRKQKRRKK